MLVLLLMLVLVVLGSLLLQLPAVHCLDRPKLLPQVLLQQQPNQFYPPLVFELLLLLVLGVLMLLLVLL